jgi:hypothetical protein
MSFRLAPQAVKFTAAVVNNECSAHGGHSAAGRKPGARNPWAQALQFCDVGG